MKKVFPLLLLILLPLCAADAPIYVVGYVYNSESGEPIAWAQIQTRSGKDLGKSNSSGRFEVEVDARNVILVFERHGFQKTELDVGELAELIDVEVLMESATQALPEKQIRGARALKNNRFKKQSPEELEQFQGMRIDLNDHLRSLEGVSGMGEYSSEISVYGGRTGDVSHYLGGMRIPNMRHLDFGYPGNQSVLNPRLLKSVSVEDNLYEGPLNQGNSSALQYELEEGNPEQITGDIVFGTINREFNLTFYWDSVMFIGSYRRLAPTFLANLGKQFYTIPKDSRITNDCPTGETCKKLTNPIDAVSEDLFFSSYIPSGGGGYHRLLFLGTSDDYKVKEDLSQTFTATEAQIIREGGQSDLLISYENLAVPLSGELETGAYVLFAKNRNFERDTTSRTVPFYQDDRAIMGLNDVVEDHYGAFFKWNPAGRLAGFNYSYGTDFQYIGNTTGYRGRTANEALLGADLVLGDALFRFGRSTAGKHRWENSLGWHSGDLRSFYPLLSTRYTVPVAKNFEFFGELACRQNTAVLPVGNDQLEGYTTSSFELKAGSNGVLGRALSYRGTLYSRGYLSPVLPVPEVYWNYREQKAADYALVGGASLNLAWEPSHHFSWNINGSSVAGDYYLSDGKMLTWEASRSLDMVSNIRMLPRKDSLLSLIMTYTVNNDVPMYEYRIPLNAASRDIGQRIISQNRLYPDISRQRADIRINLNLKSGMVPLETVRFFFQGNNLFANMDDTWLSGLGGRNLKQRGWTRLSRERAGNLTATDGNGNTVNYLTPVLIRGVGFFWMFGFEMHMAI